MSQESIGSVISILDGDYVYDSEILSLDLTKSDLLSPSAYLHNSMQDRFNAHRKSIFSTILESNRAKAQDVVRLILLFTYIGCVLVNFIVKYCI